MELGLVHLRYQGGSEEGGNRATNFFESNLLDCRFSTSPESRASCFAVLSRPTALYIGHVNRMNDLSRRPSSQAARFQVSLSSTLLPLAFAPAFAFFASLFFASAFSTPARQQVQTPAVSLRWSSAS